MENISNQTADLNDKLEIAVPELQTAADLLQEYKDLLTQIENLCDSNVELSTGMFVNMKEVGQSLVTGFVDGIQSKSGDFKNAARDLVEGFKTQLTSSAETCRSVMIAWANNVKNWFTQSSYGGINRTTFQNYAKDIVSGFASGITSSYSSSKSSVTTWASNVKQWFTGRVRCSKPQYLPELRQGYCQRVWQWDYNLLQQFQVQHDFLGEQCEVVVQ